MDDEQVLALLLKIVAWIYPVALCLVAVIFIIVVFKQAYLNSLGKGVATVRRERKEKEKTAAYEAHNLGLGHSGPVKEKKSRWEFEEK